MLDQTTIGPQRPRLIAAIVEDVKNNAFLENFDLIETLSETSAMSFSDFFLMPVL